MAIDGTLYSGSRPVLDLRRGSSPITRAVTGVGVYLLARLLGINDYAVDEAGNYLTDELGNRLKG